MDRVNRYRQIVRRFLEDFAEYDKTAQLVLDVERDRYLVIHNEWKEYDHIYGCVMQLDIVEGKVWLQRNNTEIYVDRELIQLGVAPEDIVFGFRAPSIRERLTKALTDSVYCQSTVEN